MKIRYFLLLILITSSCSSFSVKYNNLSMKDFQVKSISCYDSIDFTHGSPNMTFQRHHVVKIAPDIANTFKDSVFRYKFRGDYLILKGTTTKHKFEFRGNNTEKYTTIDLNINSNVINRIGFISHSKEYEK